jgi:hypothetical protein
MEIVEGYLRGVASVVSEKHRGGPKITVPDEAEIPQHIFSSAPLPKQLQHLHNGNPTT